MNFRTGVFVFGAALVPVACEQSIDVQVPTFPDGGLVRTGTPLSRKQLYSFEGMFSLSSGNEIFGAEVAVRTSIGTVSVLTDKNAGFAVLESACLPDHRVVVEGYWQYPTRVDAGLVRVFVDPPELAQAMCNGEAPTPTSNFRLNGFYGHQNEFPASPLSFVWSHELKPWRGRFFTIAHHGACGPYDHCGASPNSLESVRLAERIGTNAAEVDVRVTKDGFPVLFHDPMLSASLVKGLFCNGQVSDLTLAELIGSCQLKNGESLATVEQALDMMTDETELEGVYLDMKVPEAVLPSARLASKLIAKLRERNGNDDPNDDRKFTPVIAITNDDIKAAWDAAKPVLSSEKLDIPPCLVEDRPDDVIAEGCIAWGPSWTAGPQVDQVQRLRAAGAGTIYWTINQSEFMDEFLTRAQPNGVITDRAALMFFRYQAIGTPPPQVGALQ